MDLIAIVRDPAFEAAQKQYCEPLSDVGVDSNAARPKAAPKNVVEITLRRTACFGSCPAYRVSLRTDGTVSYEGHSNVRFVGRAFDQIDPAEVLALVARFDAAASEAPVRRDPRRHCAAGRNPDAPSVNVTLRRRGREQPLPLLGHCSPPHLREFVDEIDRIARTERWVTGSNECRVRGLW